MRSQGAFNPQLEEHLRNGLPSVGALRELISEHNLDFVEFDDGYLPNWLAMMLVKHTAGLTLELQINLDRWYNSHLTPFDRREPAYRHVFVIAKSGSEHLLPLVADAVTTSTPAAFPDPMFEADLARVLAQATPPAPSRVAALEAENAYLRQLLAAYEEGRFIRFMRWLHGWRRRLREDPNAG